MTRATLIHLWPAAVALSACLACGGEHQQDDRDAWTVSATSSDPGEPRTEPVPAAIPEGTARAPSTEPPHTTVFVGEIREAFAPSARERVCVRFGKDSLALDELACEPLPENRWRCGGCDMEFGGGGHAQWLLTAVGVPEDCELFAAAYVLEATLAERSAECPPPP